MYAFIQAMVENCLTFVGWTPFLYTVPKLLDHIFLEKLEYVLNITISSSRSQASVFSVFNQSIVFAYLLEASYSIMP